MKMIIFDLDDTIIRNNVDLKKLKEMLLKLKEKYVLVLFSNNSKKHVLKHLSFLDLEDVFDEIIFRKYYVFRKPLPFMYAKVLKKYSPEKIFVVGDNSFTDILGGILIGAETIYIGEKPIIKADHTINSIFELEKVCR